MNEAALKAMIEDFRPMLNTNDPILFERGLLSLVKEVERTTRHKAVSLSQALSNQLSWMNNEDS